MMNLDLKNAYFSISIAEENRKYLWFIFNDLIYEFQCLTIRVVALRTFTKVVKSVSTLLRQRGLRVIIYLDNLLLLHPDPKELEKLFPNVCQLLTNLGFLIKKEKCSTAPVQSLVFLGAVVNSVTLTLAVPLPKLQCEAEAVKKRKIWSIQEQSALMTNDPNVQDRGGISTPS